MSEQPCLLSIIVPFFNEQHTLPLILSMVIESPVSVPKEIVLVNDGSTDDSEAVMQQFIREHTASSQSSNYKFSYLKKANGGKGSAVREGIAHCTGDIILIQDADLEYDPTDYPILIEAFLRKEVKVVYGSRILGGKSKTISWIYYLGGRFITLVTNLIYGSSLTDEPTGYKVFAREIFEKLRIDSDGFEWEPEITAKILRKGYKIQEVPIRYYPRSFKQGKKISFVDGFKAIETLWKYRTWKER